MLLDLIRGACKFTLDMGRGERQTMAGPISFNDSRVVGGLVWGGMWEWVFGICH